MITAAESSLDGGRLKVYPNPTKGVVYLSSDTEFSISDLVGKEVLSGNSNEVDLSNLDAGTYLIHVEGKLNKVIKQ